MRRLLAFVTSIGLMLMGLTVVGGPAAHGTTPGKNGPIVFSADLGFGFQLYTINDDATGFHQLTNVDIEANFPDWSPAGRRIAFEFFDGEHAGVVIMDADGSNMRDLTPTGFQGQPAWTPDGRHLVYECFSCRGGGGIFIIRADGTHRRRLTTNPFSEGFDTDPNVSPDGRTVTFVRAKVEGELQALFAVDIDGSDVRKIAPYTLEVGVKHDWAPDGRHIVLTQDADRPDNRSPNVASIKPDGSHLRLLTTYAGGQWGAFAGSYSPDGRWIVFRVENSEREKFALFKMRPNGSNKTLIAAMQFAPRHIDWGSQP